MKNKFRLSKTFDYTRVRRNGKTYAHPLIVLIALPNEMTQSRVAISASRAIGEAVQRNRAKRLLREAIRPLWMQIRPGWDMILLSRKAIIQAPLSEVKNALAYLLLQASLLIS